MGFVLSIVGAKAATAKCACVKYMWVLSFMSPLLEFGPKAFLNGCRIYVVACSIRVFGGTSIRTTLFRFRSPVFSANRSAASGVWPRIGDILVIVNDHRLICELPRSCGKQECGDVGISTPNTLRCMRCHTTAPHGLVWFDVRTSRFCSFLIFSVSNFLKLIAAICCWTCL